MNAGGGHSVQALNGSSQFALQGALPVQLLDKVRLTHGVGLIEDFVSYRGGSRQALAGQKQSGGCHLIPWDHDGRPVSLGFVLDIGLIQGLGDLTSFLEVQV